MGDRRVLGALGAGAVTATFAVRRAGEPVRAGKRLSSRFADDPDARAMLRREGAILAKLSGRGAPRLVEEGADEHGPFLVMELFAMSRIGTHGARRRGDARFWSAAARAAFGALARVHEARDGGGPLAVVHGDVSPDNVLVDDDAREAAIVDFGLARYRDDPGPSAGPFRGTLAFAAPEVARGEAASARSDLFSLAATVLGSAAGEPPRRPGDFAAGLAEAAEASIDAFAARAAGALEARAGAVLRACVRFDPDARPPSAAAALAEL